MEKEQQLVDALVNLRQDSKETHFVGVSGLSRRSGSGKNTRPAQVEPGHIVVVRSLDSAPCNSYLPFYVGEVLGFEEVPCDEDSNTGPGSTWTKVWTEIET